MYISHHYLDDPYRHIPHIIAHRGASGEAPENTLAACEKAVTQGATWLEVDIAITADGVPVVFHDATLDRCSNGQGRLIQHTYGYLQRLDCGSWFHPSFAGERILTLAQLLRFARMHQLGLNLEIKPITGREQNTVWAIAQALKNTPVTIPILISSFNPVALRLSQQLLPEITRAWLTEALPDNWRVLLEQYQCSGIHYCADFHQTNQVQAIREAGYKVLAYTVNDIEQAAFLMGCGVNAVFTDYPGKMIVRMPAPGDALCEAWVTH